MKFEVIFMQKNIKHFAVNLKERRLSYFLHFLELIIWFY
jgi:hypothetical protein